MEIAQVARQIEGSIPESGNGGRANRAGTEGNRFPLSLKSTEVKGERRAKERQKMSLSLSRKTKAINEHSANRTECEDAKN